jgi:phage FluMu protein Com
VSNITEWYKELVYGNAEMRRQAAKALANVTGLEREYAIKALQDALQREPFSDIQEDILDALDRLGVPKTQPSPVPQPNSQMPPEPKPVHEQPSQKITPLNTSFFKRIFSRNKDAQLVKFLRKQETPGAIYEIYQANDAESAKTFLFTKNVAKDAYYILVETPEGAWGIDKLGLYLERLMPFQKNVQNADCDGQICTLDFIYGPGFEFAANGINESFVIKVRCGQCQREWLDAVQYENLTAVRCPSCKAINRIDTQHIHRVARVHYPIFDKFLEFVNNEYKTTVIKTMSSNSLPHELLAIYETMQTFQNAMDSAKTLPRNFHPILARGKSGGAIYIRCAFMSDTEFDSVVKKFKTDSFKFAVNRK